MNTAIKICGLRDVETAKQTIALGADYIGLVMYPGSVRYLELDKAIEIASAVKSAGGIPVPVFVDKSAEEMQETCEAMGVETVQLHGNTSRFDHYKLPEHYHRLFVIHVDKDGHVQHASENGLAQLKPDRDFLLYDGLRGGSGNRIPLKKFKNRYDFRFFLAGGLRPDRVADAIKQLHPYGVGVSSGVESAPGKKDIHLIKSFIESVRETEK